MLARAEELGLVAHGVSFHVGSQQTDPAPGTARSPTPSAVFRAAAERGMQLAMVNLGGGFPTRYLKDVPAAEAYGQAIFDALRRISATASRRRSSSRAAAWSATPACSRPRSCSSRRSRATDKLRWVYLDVGKFGGLAETMDEAIRYPIRTPHDGGATGPCVVAGPTCDSADVLYEKTPYELPISLTIGDEVLIEGTGAYTTTYSRRRLQRLRAAAVLRDLSASRPSPLRGPQVGGAHLAPLRAVGMPEIDAASTLRFASQRSRFVCIASQISGPSPQSLPSRMAISGVTRAFSPKS